MAEYSGFFNCTQGTSDRVYDADDFANFFSMFLNNGVFAESLSALQVSPRTGRTVTVKKGKALIDGYWYILDADKDVQINANTGSSVRITTVICNLNKTNRKITISTLDNPSNSGLPRDDGVNKDLVLCKITCKPSFSSISGTDIQDLRANNTYCGWVSSILETTDLESLYADIEETFNAWFNDIKDQISRDEAVQINQKIGNLTSLKTSTKSNLVGAINEIYSRRKVKNFEINTKNIVSGQSLKIFTLSELNAKFGVTGAGELRFAVSVTNGDGNVSSAHIHGTTWISNTLFVVFDRNVQSKVSLFLRIELLQMDEMETISLSN